MIVHKRLLNLRPGDIVGPAGDPWYTVIEAPRQTNGGMTILIRVKHEPDGGLAFREFDFNTDIDKEKTLPVSGSDPAYDPGRYAPTGKRD